MNKKISGEDIETGGCPPRHGKPRAAALIIVLSCLVLLSALTLGFFLSTTGESRNTAAFAEGNRAKTLADTALSFVIGQIRDATCQNRTDISWASQPGLIKTFGTDGNLDTAFKLYSSSDPRVTASSFNPASDMPPSGWATQTAQYVDLNAPVIRGSGASATRYYPILNPTALGAVAGFNVDPSWLTDTNGDGVSDIPMPVEWMYVFLDGSVGPASQGTPANPIIGRVAFWTDDDTCKLNINTASEGTYWDMPRASLASEWFLGFTMPILGEFQRIGGHPATTCLSAALGDLLPRPTFTQVSIWPLNVTGNYSQLQAYYSLNPRITDNAKAFNPVNPSSYTTTTTSQAGTVSTTRIDGNTPAVIFKSDRLYATTDELLFKPDRTPNNAAITPATLSQRDFFLTAQSRAPETTLFGTPRISIWPIQSNSTYRSPRDNLIDFCATLGGQTYSFQRGQVSLLGGSAQSNPAAASVDADWNIARNQSLFNYATGMMQATAPGFGSSLAGKWGSTGTERMMTMTLDMIRSGLSQVGTTSEAAPRSWSYRLEQYNIRGAVIPLKVTTGKGNYNGIGRAWRVCDAAIQVIPTKRQPKTPGPPPVDGWTPSDLQPPTTEIQAVLLLNFYNPMPTGQIVEPSFRVKVNSTLTVNGTPIQGGTVLLQNSIGGNGIFLRNYSFPGFAGLFIVPGTSSTMRTLVPGGTDQVNHYPFLTVPITIPQPGTATFSIGGGSPDGGGDVVVQILEGGAVSAASAKVVQTVTFHFPSWTGPLPQSVNLSSNSPATTGPDPSQYTFSARYPTSSSGANSWLRPGDIVRGVQLDPTGPSKGDYRLLATETTVPSSWFAPNSSYNSTVSAFINDSTDATVANAVAHMQNRFAFSFQNTGSGSTSGIGNGLDSGLANNPRYGSVSCTGTGYLGVNYGNNSWNYTQNYSVQPGGLVATLKFLPDASVPPGLKINSNQNVQPVIPPASSGFAPSNSGGAGDWSTAYSWCGDGAIFAAPDFGEWNCLGLGEPSFFVGQSDWSGSTSESIAEPNRVVPSPVIFGSLPAPMAGSDLNGDGATDDLQPWQSLLFCPNAVSAAGAAGGTHPGSQGAPDHLFLDLFWMPVVEPYAVSDPLSTAGKVNLNYQMAPFTYITRRTALVGALTPVQIGALSNAVSYIYKQPNINATTALGTQNLPGAVTRYPLNLDLMTPAGTPATGSFADFETRFNSGDIFRSASEICTIRLVPSGETISSLNTWWGSRQLTGTNLRQAPYNMLYSRVTTQSNTYTVHVRAQAVKKVSGTDAAAFVDGRDQIAGEWRGSFQIERYIDPNDSTLAGVDFASTPLKSLGPYYRFRVLTSSQFAP